MRSSVSSESVTATTERFTIPRAGDGYALEYLLSSTARASTSSDLSVHHVMHVDEYPGWALSEFALDAEGNLIRNLIPLSHAAHDIAHGRFGKNVRSRVALTDEMW